MNEVVERVWSVASGPYREVLLFLGEQREVLYQLGDPMPRASDVPAADRDAITNAVDQLLAELRRSGESADRRVQMGAAGRAMTFHAQALHGDTAQSGQVMLRVNRVPEDATATHPTVKHASRVDSSEGVFAQLVENIDAVFWMTDATGYRFLYVSPKAEAVLGMPPSALLENADAWIKSIVPEDQPSVIQAMASQGLHNYSGEYRVRRPLDGVVRWIAAKAFPIYDDEGMIVRVAGLATDITARKEAEMALAAQAQRDSLTQALNRRGLARTLADYRARGVRGSAILLDCDDFKDVNDKFGHGAGDVVLRQVAERIARTLRPEDQFGRVGGDEFLVFLPGMDLSDAMKTAERIRVAVSRTHLRVGGEAAEVSASFSVAALGDEVVVDQLVQQMETGIREGKRRGKNQVHRNGSQERFLTDVDAVRESLLAGEGLKVVAQRIRRLTDNEAVAVELLTRRSASDPLRDPSDFFSFAVDHNILAAVDLRCLRAALAWAAEHPRAEEVHINLFPSTLLELTHDSIPGVFGTDDLRRFRIEVVEQQFIADPEYLVDAVRALRRLGAGIVLDDVGFGQSSLEALVLLEPESVKLDRRVIRNVGASDTARRQLERLLSVVRAVGATPVAEGIETEADLKAVRELGIPYGQGFFWDQPQ